MYVEEKHILIKNRSNMKEYYKKKKRNDRNNFHSVIFTSNKVFEIVQAI